MSKIKSILTDYLTIQIRTSSYLSFFYSFVGLYQSALFVKSGIRRGSNYMKSWNENNKEQGQAVGFKTTLLRTAFRSIL